MADTNITIPELGSLTAGQVSDLLLVTRGTTGYKMLVSDIAKTIIETYAGSSLAGSAQSVKAALDSLNSSFELLKAIKTLATNADANNSDFRIEGFHIYRGNFSRDRVNFPSEFTGGIFVDLGDTDMHWQFCCQYDSISILWFRNYYNGWKYWRMLTTS